MNALWKNWPLAAALAAAVILGIAHGFETFGHMSPCELCLKERGVYWIALAVGLIGFAATRVRPRSTPWIGALLAVIFLAGAILAAYHAGVEWKVWAGPASCTGGVGHRVTAADLQRLLNGGAMAVPQCDKPAWVFLGLSMAGWNVLISLVLAAASLVASVRVRAGRAVA